MKRGRTKTAAPAVPVPQSREEAARAVARIGEISRDIGILQADLDDEVSRAKERAEAMAEPLRQSMAALTEGLRVWAEANRQTLTDAGRVKFADLGTGKILWRFRPPKVSLRGADAVIETLRALGLGRFIRVKEEVDKEALLREPDVARSVPGVTIGSDGEEFIVEPLTLELSAGAAS